MVLFPKILMNDVDINFCEDHVQMSDPRAFFKNQDAQPSSLGIEELDIFETLWPSK
jgi:hypothetical protein